MHIGSMKTAPPDPKSSASRDTIFENPGRVIEIAIKAFARAKDAAIRENDRLGVPSYGSVRGKMTMRHPPKRSP